MIKSNKVINAVLLPKVLSLAVLISFVTTAGIYVTQENKPETADISVKNVCLLGLVALLIICIGADVYSDYKKHENFSSLVVRKYLKKELGKHPELKQFEKNFGIQQFTPFRKKTRCTNYFRCAPRFKKQQKIWRRRYRFFENFQGLYLCRTQ